MKIFRNFSFDGAALTLSSITGVICLYFLFINPISYDPFEKKQTKKIAAGEVQTKSNRLVRKSSGEFSWKELLSNATIYFNDRLFTNDNSSANIKLSEGDEILMGPNTLIEVAKKEDAQEISFFKGKARLKVSGKSKSTLKIGNKKYELKGRDSELEITKSKDKASATIDLVKGNASLVTKAGEKIDIKEGSRLEIKKTKAKIKKNFLKTSLLSPFDGRYYEFNQQAKINFEWKTFGKKEPIELQVASDKKFKNIIKRYKDPQSPLSVNIEKSGKLFWRIVSSTMKNPKYSSIRTYKLRPVKLLFPKNNNYTQILIEENHALIDLVWNTNKNKKYEITIKNIDTDEIIISKKTRRTRYQHRFIPGNYEWSVTTFGEKIKGPKTKPFSLTVEKEKDPFENLPVNEISSKFATKTFLSNKILAKSPKSVITFNWDAPDIKKKKYIKYQVILKDDDDEIVLKLQTKNNYFMKDNWKKEGTYTLKYRSILGKFKGEFSKPYKFKITHPNPPLPPILPKIYNFHKLRANRYPNDETTNRDNLISWTKINPEFSYIVQISLDEDFDSIQEEFTTDQPRFRWPINQEGEYYFRIATINAWGKQGDFSPPARVNIAPPLPTKEELALIARQKREAEEEKRREELRRKKEQEKKELLAILNEKRKKAAEELKKSFKKGVKKVLSWMEFIPKSVLVSLGSSFYEYEQKSTTVNASAAATMANLGARVNFDVLDTYVGQINYMHKTSVTSTGLDFTDLGIGLIAGKHVRLSDQFDLKPTAGFRLSNLTFFKLNGTQVESFNEFFTSFNGTLMLSYQFSPTMMHDFGVYMDIGEFNQYGAEYQFIYKPKGSKWLFDVSTLYLTGEATVSDSVNEKVVNKNELQFSLQVGREFK